MPISIFSLTAAAFAIGTTEFIVVGLLPSIAKDLQISISNAGLLVSSYALAVVLIAPLITAATAHWKRRPLAISLMFVFGVANLAGGLSENYTLLLLSRVLLGTIHGVFLGMGAALASSLVEKKLEAQAISLMFAGVTVAMVVGVPLGTWFGEAYGWRAPFYVVTLLGAISILGLIRFLPKDIQQDKPAGFWDQLSVLKEPQILTMYLITAFGFGGTFVVFTFISPLLTGVTGFSKEMVSLVLMLFGGATVIGNLAGGKLCDRLSPLPALIWVFPGLILSILSLLYTASHPWLMLANVFVWGVFAFANVPIVQAGVVDIAARKKPGSQAIASGLNIAAFNLGISSASLIGGVLVDRSSVLSTPVAGAFYVAVGLALTLILFQKTRGSKTLHQEGSREPAKYKAG